MPQLYQYGREESSGHYTNLAVSDYCRNGNKQRMKNVRSNNIERIRLLKGMTREELAAKLNTTATTIYRKERGNRQLRMEELEDYARALGCNVQSLVGDVKRVPVVGFVGAGAKIYPIDDHANGNGLDFVDSPTGISDPKIVAVYVRGDSQEPLLEDGYILFYHKKSEGVEPDSIGRLCIVALVNGEIMIKKVKKGSIHNRYHLISKNADPILDAELIWASKVIDIRPS
jgi:phage repressor protein C with HTH and peptisase S24 domain